MLLTTTILMSISSISTKVEVITDIRGIPEEGPAMALAIAFDARIPSVTDILTGIHGLFPK